MKRLFCAYVLTCLCVFGVSAHEMAPGLLEYSTDNPEASLAEISNFIDTAQDPDHPQELVEFQQLFASRPLVVLFNLPPYLELNLYLLENPNATVGDIEAQIADLPVMQGFGAQTIWEFWNGEPHMPPQQSWWERLVDFFRRIFT